MDCRETSLNAWQQTVQNLLTRMLSKAGGASTVSPAILLSGGSQALHRDAVDKFRAQAAAIEDRDRSDLYAARVVSKKCYDDWTSHSHVRRLYA